MPAYKQDGKWYFRKRVRHPIIGMERVSGSPSRYGLPNSKVAAEEAERRAIEELIKGAPYEAAGEGAGRTVTSFAVAYLATAEAKDKASSIESKRQILRDHILPRIGDRDLAAVTYAVIEDVKIALSKRLGKKTVNNVLTVLRGMLALASKRGLIAGVPTFEWLRPAPPELSFLSFADADRLIAGAEGDWQNMITLAMRAGLRISELLALQWSDVDLRAKRLVVRRATVRNIESSTKSNRERAVDLSPSAVDALRQQKHLRGPYVFCDAGGQPWRRGATKDPLWKACDAAGLPRCGWHILRHTFASHLVMRGAPIKAVQELLGHASLEVTLRYAHLAPETKASAVALLD